MSAEAGQSKPAAMTARDIVDLLADSVKGISGDLAQPISWPASLTASREDTDFTFCNRPGDEAEVTLAATAASVILCLPEHLALALPRKVLIATENPRLAFLRVIRQFFSETMQAGIHPTAIIDERAVIDPTAYIGPNSQIGQCEIGAGAIIHGHVTLYSKTLIGRNVVIHSGTVIGADGFGYERNEVGEWEKFPHIGGVIIEDDVEVGANTCIDRGTLDNTLIGKGTKIDNLVHIAHNVTIGKNCTVIAHAQIAGSTQIGDGSWIAPCACLRDKIHVGKNVTVGMGSVVLRDIPDGITVLGSPARPLPA